MPYDSSTPYNLDQMDETTPTGAEDPSLLDDALRQTRTLVKEVILKEHNPDGSHKSLDQAIAVNSIGGDKIKQHSTDDTSRSIGTNHIKDGAITAAKLAAQAFSGTSLTDGSVTAQKMAASSIEEVKLASNSVSNRTIMDGAVNDRTLGTNTIGEGKLADNSISTAKLKDGSVSGAKLQLAPGRFMIGGATVARAAVIGGQMRLANLNESVDPPIAEFAMTLGEGLIVPIAVIQEVGSGGGGSGATARTWHSRPYAGTSAWSINFDKTGMVDISGTRQIHITEKGAYICWMQAVGYKTNLHQIRLRNITGTARTLMSGTLIDAQPGADGQTASTSFGVFTLVEDEQMLELQHWIDVVGVTDCFGRSPAVPNGEAQIFAQIVLMKVS